MIAEHQVQKQVPFRVVRSQIVASLAELWSPLLVMSERDAVADVLDGEDHLAATRIAVRAVGFLREGFLVLAVC